MFQASGLSSFYNDDITKQNRSSFNNAFGFSSQSSESSKFFFEDDTKKRLSANTGPSAATIALDPGCIPVTIQVFQLAQSKENGVYNSTLEGCPYSLVAWPLKEDMKLTFEECCFKISDGTGTAVVTMDISSNNEAWLKDKLKHYLNCIDDENEDCWSSHVYLRIIATLSSEPKSNLISLRAIHIAPAEYQEIAFHHTLSCAYTALKYQATDVTDHPTKNLTNSQKYNSHSSINDLENIVLPETHQWPTNPYEICVLKYVSKYRIPLQGVSSEKIIQDLPSWGYTDLNQIKTAIKELLDAALCIETTEGWIDLLLEGEYN